jgi:hypothetical protein
MGSLSKRRKVAFCLLVVLVAPITFLIQTNSVLAENTLSPLTKPSIPEFSVKFVGPPQNVPTTYKLDIYTGKVVVDQNGYLSDYSTIQITIKNQPFTPQTTQDKYSDYEWTTNLYYNVQSKLHSSQNWSYWYPVDEGFPKQSNSDYTVLTYSWDGSLIGTASGHNVQIPSGAQMDFQMQAMNGYIHRVVINQWVPYEFFGEASEWSNTQTIATPTLTNATPSPIPVTPEFSSWTILLMLSVMVAIAGLLVYFKKR